MVSIIIKEWTTKIELVPTVQKRNAAVLLRKPGRLAPQYARTNKGKTYVTISDHLSQSSVKDGGYISGAKYDTLAEGLVSLRVPGLDFTGFEVLCFCCRPSGLSSGTA